VVRVGKTTGEEVRRSTRSSPPWCVAMGAGQGQGHGGDRLSLREKMYGYQAMDAIARLGDSPRRQTPNATRWSGASDQVLSPAFFRACAALRLPSLV
jgi:hypothetical protein